MCRNLTTQGNSLEGTTEIDSHLIKNTEWGAVAYLSRSKYGKNSQVWNNPYYYSRSNYSQITGLCGKGENKQDLGTTNINDTYRYNEETAGNASTTGNVYGVYDMACGAWQYVSGILESRESNGSSYDFSSVDEKYYDSYNGYNNIKYGDAIYETSTNSSGATSWDAYRSEFISSSNPVLVRSGVGNIGNGAGIFCYSWHTGAGGREFGFRPSLVIES